MKITGYRSISTFHDWGRAVGDVNGHIKSGITEVPILILETDAGVEGIGLGGHANIEKVFPAIVGQDVQAVKALFDRMKSQVFKVGHNGFVYSAIGVIDMALWDLKAKELNLPLWKLLGGNNPFVPGYASGLDFALSQEELVALHQKFVDKGFKAFKLKGGFDVDVDIDRIKALVEIYKKNTKHPAIMVDVNESMNVKQAVRYVKALERHFDLTWTEEPVRRFDAIGHSQIRSQVNCAVATGENLTGIEQFLPLIENKSADILQAGMCWGISHFLQMANLAYAHNLPASPVGYNGNPIAHACTICPNHIGTEVQDLHLPIGVHSDQKIKNGGILLGDMPGLGFTIDENEIANNTLKDTWASSQGPHIRDANVGFKLTLD